MGATYSSPQSVAISDTTPGANIYFTTDGSNPDHIFDQVHVTDNGFVNHHNPSDRRR